MKFQADKHRSDRVFNIGDSVYLKAQPYVQTSLAPCSSNKLAFRFSRPFTILHKIGESAYHLSLPDECHIHPVFHASQLKKAIPASTAVSELPNFAHELQIPLQVLDRRLHRHQDMVVPQVLVRWSHMPATLATWEDEEPLRQQFPRAPAWGQAVSQGGKDVTVHDSATTVEASTEGVDASSEDDADGSDAGDDDVGHLKTKQIRRPNPRVTGPEWTK
jgi:hypothetical protein